MLRSSELFRGCPDEAATRCSAAQCGASWRLLEPPSSAERSPGWRPSGVSGPQKQMEPARSAPGNVSGESSYIGVALLCVIRRAVQRLCLMSIVLHCCRRDGWALGSSPEAARGCSVCWAGAGSVAVAIWVCNVALRQPPRLALSTIFEDPVACAERLGAAGMCTIVTRRGAPAARAD